MEGRRMPTRNNPRGLALGASMGASRATSLGSRGEKRRSWRPWGPLTGLNLQVYKCRYSNKFR
ncbi:unnamed protein product [Cuscuta europaea]|uniref:Uncharacterized protein n=1 Tax=Cuscuta europaea TaxID=41803 RepID=A0A9P0ZPN9_CUSEU|nr:unnamed protein product [Cuscuta europaea]